MRKIIKGYKYLFPIAALIFSTPAVSYDAVFNVTGKVAAGTCSIKSSQTQNVNLGDHTIGANGFGQKIGSTTKDVQWELNFDCDANTIISVYLTGDNDPDNNTVLRLDSNNSAKGLGIETVANDGISIDWHALPFYRERSVTKAGRPAGPIKVLFKSRYKQTAAVVTPGPANGNLGIDISYN
ncbi:fimbrial protein [Providencia sp.]|uniref:fimbrial protein n=1 Tax=Providencia sp. TaxID=589 RepID=UPI001B3CEE27|nr:fimbrial protein [Providencia sp.]MBP6082086.1 type 1 fimbrial protein [Providencia sp.]